MKKTRSRLFYLFLILFSAIFVAAVLVGFAGCSGCNDEEDDTTENPPATTVTVSSVSISPAEGLTLYVGGEGTLTATVAMSDGTTSTSETVTWASSDETVATVSGTGVTGTVKALAAGKTKITASVGTVKSAECTVTVSEASIEGVSVDPTELSLDTVSAKTGTIKATVKMDDDSTYSGANSDYSWSSDATGVATVRGSGATGTVTAVAGGKAKITVTVGGKTATCEVTVTDSVAGLSLASKLDLGLNEGSKTDTLTATVNLGSGSAKDGAEVVWSVTDVEDETESGEDSTNTPSTESIAEGSSSSIVSIEADTQDPNTITVTATAAGEATITATYTDATDSKEYTATCAVTVYEDLFVYEAEDAMLFNSASSTASSISLIGTEETTLDDGTTITNVKNFNTTGDKIVFEVMASAAITSATIDITANNAALSSGTFADNDKILTVNGETEIALTGDVTSGFADYKTYCTLTGTISLNAGINYIVLTAASTASTGYLNVDKIEIEWNDAAAGQTTPTISKVDGVAGGVADVEVGQANTLAVSDAYLMNAKGVSESLMKVETTTDNDVTTTTIKNISAGDEVVYQLNADAAVWATLDVTLGETDDASNLTVKVNGEEITGTNGSYAIYLSKNINYIELIGGTGANSLTFAGASLTPIPDYTSNFVIGAYDETAGVPEGVYTVGSNNTFTDSMVTSVVFDGEKYVVNGVSASMSEEQATAFGGNAVEGDQYIVVAIVAGAGEKIQVKSSVSNNTYTLNGDSSTSDDTFYTLCFNVTNYGANANFDSLCFTIVVGTGSDAVEYPVVLGTISNFTDNFVTGPYVEDGSISEAAYKIEGVAFTDSEVTSVEFVNGQYVVSGNAAFMTPDQVLAFWGADEYESHIADQYLVILITADSDNPYTLISKKNPDGYYMDGVTNDGFTLWFDVTNANEGSWCFTIVDSTGAEIQVVLGKVTYATDYTDNFVIGAYDEDDDSVPAGVYTVGNNSTFTGSEVTSVVFDGEKYVVNGTAGTMTLEQATAFYNANEAEDHVGDQYIVVAIVAGAGEKISVKSSVSGTTYVLDGDSTTDDGNFYTLCFNVTKYTEENTTFDNLCFTIIGDNGVEYEVVLGDITMTTATMDPQT